MKKFRTLTRDLLDDDGRQRLFDTVMKVDRVEDVSLWADEIHRLIAKK